MQFWLARVVSISGSTITAGGQPFGAAIGGALAEVFDVRTALLLVAVGVATSAIYGWYSPLRAATLPAPTE
ncbi:hypothetical protein HC891_24510 [Candidatus Gracilibacteria bacterium]|nr:hypothetical protein [Candidatus Gracilibacteria bacterium]